MCISKQAEFFSLNIDDLSIFKDEYNEVFEELFFNSITNYNKLWVLKNRASKEAKSSILSSEDDMLLNKRKLRGRTLNRINLSTRDIAL